MSFIQKELKCGFSWATLQSHEWPSFLYNSCGIERQGNYTECFKCFSSLTCFGKLILALAYQCAQHYLKKTSLLSIFQSQQNLQIESVHFQALPTCAFFPVNLKVGLVCLKHIIFGHITISIYITNIFQRQRYCTSRSMNSCSPGRLLFFPTFARKTFSAQEQPCIHPFFVCADTIAFVCGSIAARFISYVLDSDNIFKAVCLNEAWFNLVPSLFNSSDFFKCLVWAQ